MDCLDSSEIAYVELDRLLTFRNGKYTPGGVMMSRVYAAMTDSGIAVIKPEISTWRKRHKRLGMRWLKNHIFQTCDSDSDSDLPPLYVKTEPIKPLPYDVNIKTIFWKYKITEGMMEQIMKAVEESKKIYGIGR